MNDSHRGASTNKLYVIYIKYTHAQTSYMITTGMHILHSVHQANTKFRPNTFNSKTHKSVPTRSNENSQESGLEIVAFSCRELVDKTKKPIAPSHIYTKHQKNISRFRPPPNFLPIPAPIRPLAGPEALFGVLCHCFHLFP